MSAVLRRRAADANSLYTNGTRWYSALYVCRLLNLEGRRWTLVVSTALVIGLVVGVALGMVLAMQANAQMLGGR